MTYLKILLVLPLAFCWHVATAQMLEGEENELSAEEIDAAWSEQDAAREAALNSPEAIPHDTDTLGEMTAASELVVRGRVVSQSYEYDANGLPFTHTTIAVGRVLKGKTSAGEITLVQEGGPNRDDPELIVIVSDARYFSVGEEEILFLGPDAGASGPAIRHRFRLFEGQVYGEHGNALTMQPGGQRLGWSRDRNPASRFSQIHIGDHTLTKSFDGEDTATDSGEEDPDTPDSPPPDYRSGVAAGAFIAAIAGKGGE